MHKIASAELKHHQQCQSTRLHQTFWSVSYTCTWLLDGKLLMFTTQLSKALGKKEMKNCSGSCRRSELWKRKTGLNNKAKLKLKKFVRISSSALIKISLSSLFFGWETFLVCFLILFSSWTFIDDGECSVKFHHNFQSTLIRHPPLLEQAVNLQPK